MSHHALGRWAALLALLVASCGGGGSGLFTVTRVGEAQMGPFGVSGWNDFVAVWTEPLGVGLAPGPASLRVFRQDSANPDLLESLATLAPPQPGTVDFSVSEQWIVLYALTSGIPGSGWVEVMKTAGPYGSPTTVTLPAPVQVASAWNDRILTASGTTLTVYDFTTPAVPVVVKTFTMAAQATAMAGVGGGVYVFTGAGYGFVDLALGTYAERSSVDLAGVRSASAHGAKIYVGGPSKFAGHYRIARLDASLPPALSTDQVADQIDDTDSPTQNIADASCDAQTGDFFLLQSKTSSQVGNQGSIVEYASQASALVSAGTGAIKEGTCTVSCGPEESWMRRIHVHNHRVYLVPVQHQQASLYTYRIP